MGQPSDFGKFDPSLTEAFDERNRLLAERYPHKTDTELFWELMRIHHGDEVGPPDAAKKYLEDDDG